MSEQTQDKIMEYIDQIAKGLGVAAEYVLTAWTKFIILEGIIYTILLIALSILFGTVTFKIIKHTITNYKEIYRNDQEAGWITLSVVLGVISAVVLGLDIGLLPKFIIQIFIPEYHVIKDVLSIVTGN